MNSSFIFKGKRIDNGEWIIGSLITGITTRNNEDIPYILCPQQADYDCLRISENKLRMVIFEVDPSTICRCTGKRDKNGVLAFEGDVVKCKFDEELFPENETTETIVWNELGFYFVEDGAYPNLIMSEDIERCEIVGNIYDNASNTQSAAINTVINDNTEAEPAEDDELNRDSGDLLATFIVQCGKMAEENWCPSQIDMLERLFGAVLHGVPYAEWEPDAVSEV